MNNVPSFYEIEKPKWIMMIMICTQFVKECIVEVLPKQVIIELDQLWKVQDVPRLITRYFLDQI